MVISGWWWVEERGMKKCRSTSLIHCRLAPPDSGLEAVGSCMSLFSSPDC